MNLYGNLVHLLGAFSGIGTGRCGRTGLGGLGRAGKRRYCRRGGLINFQDDSSRADPYIGSLSENFRHYGREAGNGLLRQLDLPVFIRHTADQPPVPGLGLDDGADLRVRHGLALGADDEARPLRNHLH